ncbi:MAG: NAD(P)/FAD-dependent oxidoreductase, partial [Spirochaetia bacterium]
SNIAPTHSDGRELWKVHAENGREFEASAVVLTPPVPQTLSLLDESGIDPGVSARQRLDSVEYSPCICVMAVCREPHPIPGPGAIQLSKGPVQWMADNYRKGISPDVHALTIHTTPDWSNEHYDEPDEVILELVAEALQPWLSLDEAVMQVKRWRYARVSRRPGGARAALSLRLETGAPLYCAGDGLVAGRVESAALSGKDAAERLVSEQPFSPESRQS